MTTQNANSAPEMSPEEIAIPGLSPQMLACLLMGVILFGVVVSGAYIITRRSIGPGSVSATAPVLAAAPMELPSPVAQAPRVSLVQMAIQPQPRPQLQPLTITAEETRGKTFLQVGAIELAAAPLFVSVLASKGFSPRIAEGPSVASVRILLGPLSGTALAETQARLTAAGLVSFPRAYQP